ncbi:uncharacterized protein PEZ65_005759 isoform 2-T2 [Lycodopsis pacificus]
MKKTFACDESMIITIPIGSLRVAGEGQLMPETFQCVYKDSYKVFAIKGKPKPLGFVVCGILSYAAGQAPNMHVTKLSFSLNIVSFFWSIAAVSLCLIKLHVEPEESSDNLKLHNGIKGLIMTLLVVEQLIALSLIYWLSKAVCRQHFNTLPIILLKHGD